MTRTKLPASWLKVLRQDSRAITQAASKAQQAVDWLMKKEEEGEEE
jgi:antirestriction protein ArdC